MLELEHKREKCIIHGRQDINCKYFNKYEHL